LWYNVGMETETLLAFSAGATFLLALAAFWAIWQTRGVQIKNRKERLLKEIIEWVIDIQKTSLEERIPVVDRKLTITEVKRMNANTLLRHGIPFIRNEYIKAIAREAFKEELLYQIEDMISAFTAFTYIDGKKLGMKDEDIKASFGRKTPKIIMEIEEQLKEKEKELDELWNEYAGKKSDCATILLIEIGNIMANL